MAIMMGLAIGAAMGGGIAALRGGTTNDILKGALIGGATGAVGGGIAPLLSGGAGAGVGAATVAEAAPIVTSESILANAGAATNPIATNTGTEVISSGGTNLGFKAPVPSGWGMPSTNYGADAVVAQGPGIRMPAPDTSSLIAGKQPGFFDSGVGKFLADNKGTLGLGAAGLLMANKSGSSQSSQPESDSYIRPYEYSQVENPDYKGAGTPYFKQSFTAKAPIKTKDFGATTVANGGIIRMAEGGETTQEQRESTANPTLEALAAIQQAQQSYQPPQPTVSQGITQPLIQPQMANVQQQYAAAQRQAPAAFQYEAPAFTKYGITSLGGGYGSGGGGGDGSGGLIDPVTKQPVKTAAQIIAAVKKPVTPSGGGGPTYSLPGGDNPANTYTGPGVNGDAASYYDRYPIAEVYDYTNNRPTRPNNPTEGSPEFNVPSNQPVDPSSGLAEIQQRYANMGYTDYTPSATNTDSGAANGGLMPDALHYAMGGGIGGYYPSPDDGNRNFDGISGLNQGPQYPMQGVAHADGGVMNYAMGGQLGGYSDGGQLLKGPGDGVSDDIPAQIGTKQPARLADGEFVVPARIVSELGNGSTDAGAKRLYAMMERVQANRKKTIGKGKVAVNSKSDKYLPT